ncbi:MAG: GLUG motif-containing protein [Sedimentisphaerales bacterium]
MSRARNSSLLGKITVVFVIFGCCLSAQAKYGGGSGSPEDPYLIYTAEQMNAIGADATWPNDLYKCFRLMADIDLSGYTGASFNIIGTSWNKAFGGTFDGNGRTISNFTYTSTDKDNIGLFGNVRGENAEIKNLGLINPNVDAGTGNSVGSLVGKFWSGNITNCYAEGASVSGNDNVGGLVGRNGGTISNCSSTSTVIGTNLVGGLVGGNAGTITNCFSTGSVEGNTAVGGLVGNNGHSSTITNCYSTASVSGDKYIGGLVGYNGFYRTIANCYSTGSVSGNYRVGGLVGGNYDGEVIASFWDIETSGQTTSAGGMGKTTAEMQTANTFTRWWGCEPVWTIDESIDYPRLVWENKPGEIITIPQGLYGGGTGEPNNSYLIYTAEQLNAISLIPCLLSKHFKLITDIDLGSYAGDAFNIIGNSTTNFSGVFDGNGHTISNFSYNSTGTNYIGLFGYVEGEIKNLRLINPNVDAGTRDYVGSLVGYIDVGAISNCYTKGGSVVGDRNVGGLVGLNGRGKIINSYSTCTVSGNSNVGGLIGYNFESTITNCYSKGIVDGYEAVGGLVGSNEGGAINNCCSTSTVIGANYLGGLVGLQGEYLGGAIIKNCYAAGDVSGNKGVGGLVGSNWEGEVYNSFWDVETSGQEYSDGGTGLTTTEMQTMSTFTDAGWDFVGETVNGIEDIWFIPQQDYPHLWWEGMQVPMKLTPRTLNCRSKGNWVKAHITLPEGFTVVDVDCNRPAVLHSFGFESAPLYVSVNKNKLVQIEAAFEREAVCSLAGDWPQELTVAGFMADGSIFLGTSTVRIIHPGMNVIEELAWYWLNADCVHPDFCDGIDMNRDSLVNLLDYALLMNIKVEFVTDE